MAQAPAYNREKNFTLNSGRETDHAALNAELDRASNSINDIRANLAVLQADDGRLRPALVTADSISEELRISLVEGVVLDAQAMLDKSLVAAEQASACEKKAEASSAMAANFAFEAKESAKTIALATHSDWNASDGAAMILNKPVLSAVALSGNYEDLTGKPEWSEVAFSGEYGDLKNSPPAIPSGFIGMWSGADSAIPSGWALCNGENGTPDLRDRFIVGAGGTYVAGETGGKAMQSVAISGNTGETTLTQAQMPGHTHTQLNQTAYGTNFSREYVLNYTGYSTLSGTSTLWETASTGGSSPHSHSLSVSADVNTLPPYYALCFIMKR